MNRKDPWGLDDENGDNPDGGGGGTGGAGPPTIGNPFGNNRVDPKSAFPECNRGGNPVIEKKLTFTSDFYGWAIDEANTVQDAMPFAKLNVESLAITFLQWSMQESGYGLDPNATINHNYFGNGAQNSQYSVTCPAGASPGPACYSAGFDWGAQLAFGLSLVPHTKNNPNPTNLSYGGILDSVLASNPDASTTQILNAIGDAGWNPYGDYGGKISGITVPRSYIDCLKKNGYI